MLARITIVSWYTGMENIEAVLLQQEPNGPKVTGPKKTSWCVVFLSYILGKKYLQHSRTKSLHKCNSFLNLLKAHILRYPIGAACE